MGSKKFTLLELHLDGDTQFGPKTVSDVLPFGEKTEADIEDGDDRDGVTSVESDEAVESDDESGGRGAIGVVLGLAAMVAIAVAVKKFRGDDGEELEDREEPDVIVN